ncbi:MAG: hypothetical protein K0R51_143 [Cytophagaceae bacterium]|jgi:hypothetical protein|nr:hypothetical protein [Cytophagaceae bacterium]
MKLKHLLLPLLFLSCFSSWGQSIDSSSEQKLFQAYHTQPVWIAMMSDPNVNYFEACTAFEMYWTGREIPAEAEGEANKLYDTREKDNKSEREQKKDSYKKEEHEDVEGLHFQGPHSYTLIYEYKQFINWRRVMKNRVDPQTGRILTTEEQDAIWRSQTQGVNTHIVE